MNLKDKLASSLHVTDSSYLTLFQLHSLNNIR